MVGLIKKITLVITAFALTTISVQALIDESGFKQLFDPYLGVWQGEYRIYSQQDEELNRFKVNRNYWWEGDVLMGRISYDFGESKQVYFHRIILSEGLPFSFVTDDAESGTIKTALRGENLRGTMVWDRVLPKDGMPVRISERIISNDGQRFIEFWGNQEAKNSRGESLLVRIDGFLSYLEDSRDFVVAGNREAVADSNFVVPDMSSAIESVEEELEVVEPPDVEEPQVEEQQPIEVMPPANTYRSDPVVTTEIEPKKTREPSKSLERELAELNIVGIDDRVDSRRIIVDYFNFYEIGDRMDTDKSCFFAGFDANYVLFEDSNGTQYKIFRKDVEMGQ